VEKSPGEQEGRGRTRGVRFEGTQSVKRKWDGNLGELKRGAKAQKKEMGWFED